MARVVVALLFVAGMVPGCGGHPGAGEWQPPGPCENPRAPAQGELERLDSFPGGGRPQVLIVDLDGDRAPDRLVSETGLCDRFGNCGFRIYLMRGTCGHALGTVWAAKARAGLPERGPLGDLVVTTRDGKGEFEEWYQLGKGEPSCVALRERQMYRAGHLDPQASWGTWEGCE